MWGPGLFDPKTVQTVTGAVIAVERFPSRGMMHGVHLRLRTGAGEMDVHLGPAWFVETGEMTLKVGDRVQVRGSRVAVQGKPALIAATLTRGEMTLRLRDADGYPYWAGWRRRPSGPGWRHGPGWQRGPATGPRSPGAGGGTPR
jgi:hypothetical protein